MFLANRVIRALKNPFLHFFWKCDFICNSAANGVFMATAALVSEKTDDGAESPFFLLLVGIIRERGNFLLFYF